MNLRSWFTGTKATETIKRPWVKRVCLALLGLFVSFSLFLFFAGPPLLKSYLTESLSRKLGRKVSVGAIHVNPLELSVAIDDFSLAEHDGKTPFVAFRQAYVNAQLASIVFAGPVMSEIRLTEPRVNLVRTADNTYNFQDIIERLSKNPAEPQKKEPRTMRFSLNNIRIIKGWIDFDDEPRQRRHTIRDLNVAVPFLSNLFYRVNDYVAPSFSATVNGAPFRLTGRSKPFEADRESSLDLKLNDLALGEYLTYIPKKLYFTLPGGKLDADIKICFVQPKGKAPALRLTGSTALHNFAMNEAKEAPTVRIKSLEVALESIEPLVKRFTVGRITLDKLELFVHRDRQGRLNLANLMEPDKEKKPMPYFLVREVNLGSSAVHVRDEQRARPFEAAISDINLRIRNLTSEKGKTGQVELTAAGPGKAALKAATDLVLEPLSVSKLNVEIADLEIRQPGGKTDIARIGRLGISGGAFDLERRSVVVEEFSLSDSLFNIQRSRKGVLNVSELAGGSSGKTKAATKASPAAPPWQYEVKKASLSGNGVHWRDAMPAAGVADIRIEKIIGNLENISSKPNTATKLSLKALVGRTGQAGVDGSVVMTPEMSAKLQLKAAGLPILPIQPYFADRVNIRVTSGTVSAQGQVAVRMKEKAQVQYQGNVQVNRFASVDNLGNNDFLKWETLRLGGVNVVGEPLNVAVNEISLSNFYSRLIINPDGTINIQHILGRDEESRQAVAGGSAAVSKPPVKTAAASEQKSAPAPIKIARVTLQGGRINFSDRFIKPNYSANLTSIGGRISGLSSDLATTADVEIRGRVDNAAPVEIQGKINPLTKNLFLDLTASARGVDLPPATPYSGRYAGYPIIKGKLSMTVKYHVENRKLTAENHVLLDQLTFGDKVESPRATKLPVLLAVALLKDRNGVIDVNLPISGSLDDPQFSIGGIIVRVIVNLITKAVTAPFALLGNLFGGGEELSFIEFDPGRANLDKTAGDKISSLARALDNRPALKLDITGRIDRTADTEGVRHRILERKVKAVKLQKLGMQAEGPSGLDEISIAPAEYPKLLKQAYSREKFPKPRNVVGLEKDLPVTEMEKLMLANIPVSDDDLRQLGIRRARTVADALTRSGVSASRVFILEPKLKSEAGKGPSEKARGSRVDFSLK